MATGLPAKRYRPPPDLFLEIARAVLVRLATPLRTAWRRNWFYRRLLKGKLSDRVVFHPHDALPRKLEDADALLRGRFRFNGDTLDIIEGSVFDKAPPSRAWHEALHSFAWLPPLAAAGGEPARTLATNLIAQWVKRYPRYSEPEWLPHVMARRLVHLFAHGKFVIPNSDVLWRSKLFVSLREQSRQLSRSAASAPDGFPRFETAAALVLSGACLDDSPKRLLQGLERLEAEVARQILPDGGYADRSPETLLHAYRLLVMVTDALTAIDRPVPSALLSAHDRIAPMLRFFRHGDGALALFNGGRECDRHMIAGLLARDEVRGASFAYAPHSKFQRLVAAKSYAVMDCGPVPVGVFSNTAHAGCLSFEFSRGTQRIVVNCGASPKWDGALRATAAHSTVTLADTSTGAILSPGVARDLVGARMLGGPHHVASERRETAHGWQIDAHHDGYLRRFGVMHGRKLMLSPDGGTLTGADTLTRRAGQGGRVPFAIRFHVHPEVRVTPAQGGDVLLKLPSGEGWRFRAGAQISIEESVYAGGDSVRKTEQLVLAGEVGGEPIEIAWVFERIGVA
jgi:uncharacterized heparinase superfamily protein